MSDFKLQLAEEVRLLRSTLDQRGNEHGDAAVSFQLIAHLTTLMLIKKLRKGQRITAVNVADIMAIMKVSRMLQTGGHDSRLDMAGYAVIGGALDKHERVAHD